MARTNEEIAADIIASSKITRDDIFDLLEQYEFLADAKEGVAEFLETLPSNTTSFKGDKNKSIFRVLDDLDSYREWPDELS